MKTTLIIITIFSSFSLWAYDYDNIGSLPKEVTEQQNAEYIQQLVANTRELRKEAQNFRNIASFTAEDEYWANEYEKLMADTTEKDYLSMAENLP